MDEWMKETLIRIDGKIDRLDERVGNLEVHGAAMTKDLNYHIHRTNLLEDELKPIKNKHEQLKGILKFIGGVVAISSAIESILHLILKYKLF